MKNATILIDGKRIPGDKVEIIYHFTSDRQQVKVTLTEYLEEWETVPVQGKVLKSKQEISAIPEHLERLSWESQEEY